ncbi:hypothetical protein NCLIV_028460 [Neospora caninum Liverpool]|uniref:Histone deacetylase domain-containing protein n=1 Tax=Neospora caninum (strain Liverpool) TaxID=572307 RepID=F0VH63_NEOCL|nr:hypothetical protein NCLIV_028460 [Neospora caninum Liverpool]CBZ53057.1 hypothetical protein NCLIV_028460 [Neospora caninum Liverpool]|eukprot:XP_003883089.1 hypothetical protein NCLIV_028460 [Neospora caninum Liverpool]
MRVRALSPVLWYLPAFGPTPCSSLSATAPPHGAGPQCPSPVPPASPSPREKPTVCLYIPCTHAAPSQSASSAPSPSSVSPPGSPTHSPPADPPAAAPPAVPPSRSRSNFRFCSDSCREGLLLALPSVSPTSLPESLKHFLISYTSAFPARSLPLLYVDAVQAASPASAHTEATAELSAEQRQTCAAAVGPLVGTADGRISAAYTHCDDRPSGLPIVYTPCVVPPSFPRNHALQPQKLGRLFAHLAHQSERRDARALDEGRREQRSEAPEAVETADAKQIARRDPRDLAGRASRKGEPEGDLRHSCADARGLLRGTRTLSDPRDPTTPTGAGTEKSGRATESADKSCTDGPRREGHVPASSALSVSSPRHCPGHPAAENRCGRDGRRTSTAPQTRRLTDAHEPAQTNVQAASQARRVAPARRALGTSVASRFSLFSPIQDADVTCAWLRSVHTADYVRAASAAALSEAEERKIGLPVTKGYASKSLAEVTSTVLGTWLASHFGMACVVGGGTHHAKKAHGGKFCVFNDVAVAAALALKQGIAEGYHTCKFCFLMPSTVPGMRRSDVDVALPAGTGDEVYLHHINEVLPRMLREHCPSLVFYVAGVDIHERDTLGNFQITDAGIKKREELVFSHCLRYNQELMRRATQSEERPRTPDAAAERGASPCEPPGTTPRPSGALGVTIQGRDGPAGTHGRRTTWTQHPDREASLEQEVGTLTHGVKADSLPHNGRPGDATPGRAETSKTPAHAVARRPVAICSVVAGGYSDDIQTTVESHAILFETAAYFWTERRFPDFYTPPYRAHCWPY